MTTIKACGNNSYGQLGLNDITQRSIFVNVTNITGVKQISCGDQHSLILMNTGNIKTCGWNAEGQLGLNDLVQRVVFTDVPNITEVADISCGHQHTIISTSRFS